MGAVVGISGSLSGAAARARAAECRALLGGERDAMRAVWDAQATDRDRRLLLAMAGVSGLSVSIMAGRAWGDLKPEMRGAVRSGLARFRGWADRVGGAL